MTRKVTADDEPDVPDDEPDLLTVRIRRSHLLLTTGLLVGFGLGVWVGSRGGTEPRLVAREVASPPPAGAREGAPPPSGATREVAVDVEGRPSRGPEDAPVTVVEFTDYQCPFCRRHFRETYPSLIAEYDGEVRYVVRNFPLTGMHPDARKAAEAAECAFAQGRFWDYHDRLFEGSSALDAASLRRYAAELGLDTERFDACLASGEMTGVVDRDLRAGRALGVSGTPTFFIDSRPLRGAQPVAAFRARIDRALAEARAEPTDP